MLVIFGEDPMEFVVTEEEAVEFAVVQAEPDNALNTTVYAVPELNPVIVNGLVIPGASKNEDPLSIEY